MTKIDPYSFTTVPVQQYANGRQLRSATAFVWKRHEKHYLITNWHVLTGKNAQTRELELQVRPEILRAFFDTRTSDFWKAPRDIALRDSDGNPIWFIHPDYRKKNIDLAAIPLSIEPDDPEINFHPINNLKSDVDLKVAIGMDVFILGYPYGFSLPGFPIWKRGSIASEPDLVPFTDGYLHVDTASRPGMSGGPVIRRSWGTHSLASGGTSSNSTPQSKFIGVYSGRRNTKDPTDAQLGMVWLAKDIEEIVGLAHLDCD
jgi:hypothetical protein